MCHKLTMSGGIIMKFVHGGQIMVIRGYNHNHYCPMGDTGNWQELFLINWNSPL